MDIELRRLVTGLTLLLFGAISFYLTDPDWLTPSAVTAFYSVLAFLSVAITVSAVNRHRTDPSPANNMFIAGMFYSSIIFAGAAIYYILSTENPAIHFQTSGIFLNLVAFATTGVIMLLYSLLNQKSLDEKSIFQRRIIIPIINTLGIILFGLSMIGARQPFDQIVFLIAGFVVGITAIVCYFVATYVIIRQERQLSQHDPLRLATAFFLLGIAAFIHTLILPTPSSLWIISISLMVIAFNYAIFSTSRPFLIHIGIDQGIAYRISAMLSAIVLLPFLLAGTIDTLSPFGLYPSLLTSITVHLSGALLAAAAAYVLYIRTSSHSEQYYDQIVYLLLAWIVVEVAIVVSHFTPLYGFDAESSVAYVCGMLSSCFFLAIAVKRTLTPLQSRAETSSSARYLVWIICFSILIIIGELVRIQLLDLVSIAEMVALEHAVMLGLSYIALFMLMSYIMILAGALGGRITFETMTAGMSALWIIIVILKVNSMIWTVRWWAAEFLIFLAVAVSSLVVLRKHLKSSVHEVELESQAGRYSRFVSRQITELHSRLVTSLTSLSMDSAMNDSELSMLSGDLAELTQASDLVRFMEFIITGEEFPEDAKMSVDLVDSIVTATTRLRVGNTSLFDLLNTNRRREECYVWANQLLTDAFHSIIYGIMHRFGNIESINAEIGRDTEQSRWITQLLITSSVTDARVSGLLFKRYTDGKTSEVIEFAYGQRLFTLFKGSIDWNHRQLSDHDILLECKIGLPIALD